jgi:branched-chain amino acid transport system ATP-binding protein
LALPADRRARTALLDARDITVRFGGLLAADGVSLSVREGEIVGLIGPNGAGKTTTFNAISGLNTPTAGTVELFGVDVTNWPVHRRAALGTGRTFQLIQLFPQLTVFENLLVATHLHHSAGVLAGAVASGRCLQAEARARDKAREVVSLLKLEEVADRPAGGLPFGVLRMVEVGRALVTEPRLIMLDEPASGLDNAETDRLSELLRFIRSLGVALLLIEHDVRMVTGVSDYMYVIDRGRPLAEGTPAEIQRHPDVIAAYLGDAHAIPDAVEVG